MSLTKKNLTLSEKLFVYSFLSLLLIWLTTYTSIVSLSWIYSYQEIIKWKVSKNSFLQGAFLKYDIPFKYENYQLARLLAIILWLIIAGLIFLFLCFRDTVYKELQKCFYFITDQIRRSQAAYLNLFRTERVLLIFILFSSIGLRIYYYFYMPPHFDELSTYFQFVEQGFLFINVFYPYPNNHVFFNHVYLFFSLFVDDPILAGRLPSMIFFHILLIVLFIGILRMTKNVYAAFLSLIICIFYFPSSVYAVEARGYMFLSLLLLIASYALLLGVTMHKKEAFYIFIPACILAAFTVPVFFVPFLGLMIFGVFYALLNNEKLLLKRIAISGIFVGLGVLLCYLPMFLFSGIKAVVANETVASLQAPHFYTYNFPIATAEILTFLVGTSTKGWVFFLVFGVLGILAIFKFNTKTRLWLGLSVCILSALFIYALVRKSFMLERSTTYNSFFVYSSSAIIFVYWINYLIKSKRTITGVIAVITLVVAYTSYFQYHENVYEPHLLPSEYYSKVRVNINATVKESKTIYLEGDPFQTYPMLYYEYMITKFDLSSLRKGNYHEAEVLILNKSELDKANYNLQEYTQVDKINELPGWVGTSLVVFYKKHKF